MFVLPSEDLNTIHPRTFMIASFMAASRPIRLAIPVLASLYRRLNKIVHSSPTISCSGACFPVQSTSSRSFSSLRVSSSSRSCMDNLHLQDRLHIQERCIGRTSIQDDKECASLHGLSSSLRSLHR